MANPIDLTYATSLEEQFYLCGLSLQAAELAIPEDDRPDQSQINYSTEGQTVEITGTLTIQTMIENNSAVISVIPYLS